RVGAELDFLVLRGSGVESQATLSYAVLADLLDGCLDQVTGDLPDPLCEALEIAVLRRRAPHSEVDPHAVARASLTALTALAQQRPVLVLVDDAHWLDAETARVLAFVMPRLGAARVAVVVATRDEPPRAAVDLAGALRSMPDRRGDRTVVLKPLSPEQISLLLARDAPRALTRGELRRIDEVGAGNPLFALELARSLRESDPGAPLDVPGTLDALIGRRVGGLPASAVAVLATIGLVAKPTRALVGAATGLRDHEVDAALDSGLDAGVITERDGDLAFVHPLIGLAVTTAAPVSALRSAHLRLVDCTTDPEERAVHLARAISRPDADTAAAIEEGAEVARRRAAPDVAAQLGEAALRLTPPENTADRRRRHVATAYHHVAAGSIPSALEHVAYALPLAEEREDIADLEWRQAMFHFLLGDLDAAVEGLRTARRTTTKPELRDELTRRLANMLGWQGRMRDALEDYGRDLERISTSGTAASASALAIRTICCHVLGRPLPADPLTQVRQERELHPETPAHDDPSIRLAAAILTTTDPRSAVQLHESALQQAVTHGDDLGIAWLASRISLASAAAGDWQGAEEMATASLMAAERLASPPALVYALTSVGTQAALLDDATTALDAARRLDPYGAFMFAAPQAALIRGYAAWTDGDATRASELFDTAEQELRELGIVEPTVPFLRWYRSDVLIDAGRLDDATEEADRLLQLGSAVDHTLARAIGLRARARLDSDGFEEALAAHEIIGWPLERALTHYHHGVALRRLRRIRDARTALTEALGAFTGLGASRW
ncbi:MAG: hypothetical protein ACTHJM_16210, partial [Marmoricola sp.]